MPQVFNAKQLFFNLIFFPLGIKSETVWCQKVWLQRSAVDRRSSDWFIAKIPEIGTKNKEWVIEVSTYLID